jgi:hypothetical protein
MSSAARIDAWRSRHEGRASTIVLASDPYVDPDREATMELRLTYDGDLFADPLDQEKRIDHKQELRKTFHRQLRTFWQVQPFLNAMQPITEKGIKSGQATWHDFLGTEFPLGPYRFLPLITEDIYVFCSVSILFLRVGLPGSIYRSHSGDMYASGEDPGISSIGAWFN